MKTSLVKKNLRPNMGLRKRILWSTVDNQFISGVAVKKIQHKTFVAVIAK
jgi:hypothetical protein